MHRCAAACIAVVALSATLKSEQAAAGDGVDRPLALRFDEAAARAGYTTFLNSGTAALNVSVIAENGGQLTLGRPRLASSGDHAVRYPAYSSAADAPHAVIQIRDRSGTDDLNPGTREIVFGADFRLNRVSEDDPPGGRDNGDNVLQRGLYDQQSQYKVQVDHRIAMCRVKGSAGVLTVASSGSPVEPGVWYRVRCRRSGETLAIRLTTWQDGVATSVLDTVTGPTGDVSPARRSVPVSVGGKLAKADLIANTTDQFNGRVDNVVIKIG